MLHVDTFTILDGTLHTRMKLDKTAKWHQVWSKHESTSWIGASALSFFDYMRVWLVQTLPASQLGMHTGCPAS